ncbi:MAG: S-layer homology domain-containing protein [Bacillota bacterium]
MKERRTGAFEIAKGVILVLLLSVLLVSVAYAATGNTGAFKDTVGHWANSSIQRLASLGILGGYSDDTFKPNRQVTRAQLAAVIDRTLDVLEYDNQATEDTIAKGARLYDSWATEIGATLPANDNPLWASQTINKRSGYDTWRCKECHGWDYKGKGGAYGTGSHATGFPGVYRAATTMSKAELVEVLKGSTYYRHDFSSVLDAKDLEALAAFLKEGLINETTYINYSSKKPVGANLDSGMQKYNNSCATLLRI